MTVIVTDRGFAPDDWSGDETRTATLAPEARATDLADRLGALDLIRVSFPSFADGRGFTLARDLRRLGYAGRLRACGHLISDQYAMARRSGFDEVEISDDLAARQPEAEWLFRARWRAHDYQSRLRGQSALHLT
ncbi:DUF934 domain-containing protein [Pseudodonghicola flavimaris]|uniref:DUF934 domain-containing protein n=1 Tax=Pseudodonghicola flavimaris TaxID=3050036 RepID=A0ABT7F737_9RHOB|nr:DUF934 domain-containing protein [Pseudodonghicola flavimaris]MDK3020330.1 DUF934 domain-containing protein [Pseudodonghicola flavimaris]